MNPSTNMNGSQHAKGQSYNMLDGMQSYAGPETLQNGEDLSRFFDPDLFESTAIGKGFSQPSLPRSDAGGSRQSHTPDMHQYSAPQQNYSQSQYPQPFYTSQQMNQSSFDPRFYSRPSPTPVSFDGGYPYQAHVGFTPQHFTSQQMNVPQRQTPTPTQSYPPRQQQPAQFVNIAQRPPPMSHVPSADMMRFGSFHVQDQTQQPSNRFVDPSMLTANQPTNTSTKNGNHTFQAQQPYLPSSYFNPGPTVDPRSLQSPQSMPSAKMPQPVVIVPKLEQATKPAAAKDPTGPKKPRGRPRKDASAQAGDQAAGSAASSDDELEIEDEEPPEMIPALLAVSMPADERGRALYRAVQAVWSPRNKPVDPEKVRGGIANYGDTIRGLRDAWKTKNETLRKAELPNSPTAAEAARLKEEVARYRQLLETVMLRSLQYSHPAILKRLGENQFTMSALSSFILDRINVSDFDSPLTNAILKFVVNFETLDSEMLEMTKLSKILQRLTKKATSDIKTLAQTVLDNAAAASAKKAAAGIEKKPDKPGSPRSVGSPADGSRKDVSAGTKRTREGEAASQPAAKKAVRVIPQASKPLAVRLEEKRKAEEAAKRAKTGEKTAAVASTAAPSTSAANPTTKSKVAVSAPPKASIFAALSSVPKKPGTPNAERAAVAAKEKTSPVAGPSVPSRTLKKESPPRNVGPTGGAKGASSSSFLGVLLDMEKKPDKEVKKETEMPNETEEQRMKRLRKEARRKLRVAWKADDKLVETRFFTHDPDEELGQGDRLKANAGGGREGEALKLHKNMEDLDDEEDEDAFEEFEPYTPPSEVDFTYLEDASLGEDSPHKTNSPKFGGSLKPESRSREAQDKYEQDTLMAIYTSKVDRPPTPKEPAEEEDFEPAEPETPFGEPTELTREREKAHQARQVRTVPQPSIDLNALAQAMAAQQRPQQQSAGLTPELQRALGMFAQPAPPAPVPQATPAPGVNLQAILQSVLGQQMPSQTQQPVYPATTDSAPYAQNNLSALLASMQQGTQGASAANALPLGMGGNPNPFPGGVEDSSRKHGRSDSDGVDDEYGRKGGNKKKKAEAKPYNYKTQTCTFWQQGKCLKGDSCTYRHGEDDE
ncbi:C-x8-C-x5-C-x3-H type zinc finger protein [Cladophialophora carrionii]|uniref:C-x8-C-x5-C-x3-H type zinc finger protein n=1 Tax=Cladophialophora carrionii TaxID=86049 RepID=A0A1C1CGD6_9EURO|nr:C-x8-C-x5-C-x3-H type zinc finger protein [Cladophialophora carrionii]